MKSLKKVLALIFAIGAFYPAVASQADIVVLLDSSGTILPFFEEINSKVLVDITKKFVQPGDTFHLISFNSRVNLEIVQPINTEEDLSRIVSRFMLLYPLGQNSDFISGLHYTLQYVSSLDQMRDKIIIVISDGIFNPPASSPYASFTNEQVKTEIANVARQIRGAGWNVFYIKLPFPEDAKIISLDNNQIQSAKSAETDVNTGKNATGAAAKTQQGETKNSGSTEKEKTAKQYYDVSGEFTDSLGIKQSPLPADNTPVDFIDTVMVLPEVEFPADLGKQSRVFTLPLRIKNSSKTAINLELIGVYANDVNLLGKNSFLNLSPNGRGTLNAEIRIPKTFTKGPQSIPVRLEFSENRRVIPQTGVLSFTLTGFTASLFLRAGVPFVMSLVFVILALALAVFLIVFIAKKTSKPASEAVLASSEATRTDTRAGETASNAAPTQKIGAKVFAGTQRAETTSPLSSWNAEAKQYPTANSQKPSPLAAGSASANTERLSAAHTAAATSDKERILASAAASAGTATSLQRLSAEYAKDTKKYPVAVSEKNTAADREILSLAENQAAEKKRGLSLLSAAVERKIHKATIAGASADDPIAIKRNAKVMLELIVDRQNPNIGKRNIHMMKAGTRLAIGGGNSPFLIFLVKFPPRIAEIRYDGEVCSLAILKPQYFPEETSNIIADCVGKTVKVVSDKDYEITISLRTYEDPVVKLNRVLTSIQY